VIDLNSIDVIVPQMLVIPLHSEKHGTKGSIRINVQFTPGIIVRDRKNTSTFTGGAGRAMTTVGSAPIALGKGVGKGVFAGGKGMVHGVGHAGRSLGLVKKKDHAGNEILVDEEVPNGNGTHHEVGATNATGEAAEGAVSEHGMLSVTCVTSKDLVGAHEGKAYVQLKLGDKTHKTGHHKKTEWCVYLSVIIGFDRHAHAFAMFRNETLRFTTSGDTNSLSVKVFDHKTLGKDKELGEAVLDVGVTNLSYSECRSR
jgi:hypothetical protein